MTIDVTKIEESTAVDPDSDQGDEDGVYSMTVEEFRQAVQSGIFVESDGSAYYANPPHDSGIQVQFDNIQGDRFTHIFWYNK